MRQHAYALMSRAVLGVVLSGLFWQSAGAGDSGISEPRVKLAVPRKLTLTQGIEIALRQNPDILKQEQEIERTQGLVIEVAAQALPQISVDSAYNQQDQRLVTSGGSGSASGTSERAAFSDSTGAFTPQQVAILNTLQNASSTSTTTQTTNSSFGGGQDKSWNVNFEVKQILYSGGQVLAAIKVAGFQKHAALYNLRDTVDTVIANVRRQYYQIQYNRVLIDVQRENLAQAKGDLKDQQDRLSAGTVPRYNVLRAEVEVANVLPQLTQAQNNYKIAQLELAKTLGLDYRGEQASEDTIQTVGTLDVEPYDLDIEDAVNLAKIRRASLKAQRETVLTQVENIRVQAAGYKPTISANAGYTFENSPFSRHFSDTIDGWFFGFTGTWNIFDGGATYGRVKQARAELEQARLTYVDTVRQVELEVQDAYSSLVEARALLASQKKNIETAEEALRLSQERFRAGAGVQLDILDARVALVQARTNEVQARFNYNTALAELQRATASDTRYDDTFNDPLTRLRVKDPVLSPKLLAPPRHVKSYTTEPKPVQTVPARVK